MSDGAFENLGRKMLRQLHTDMAAAAAYLNPLYITQSVPDPQLLQDLVDYNPYKKMTPEKTIGLTQEEAFQAMSEGKKVRLPEWVGYWFIPERVRKAYKDFKTTDIRVLTVKGEVLDTPWIEQTSGRTDFMIVEGGVPFETALQALKRGLKVRRTTFLDFPNYLTHRAGDKRLENLIAGWSDGLGMAPYQFTMEDILATDWEVVVP